MPAEVLIAGCMLAALLFALTRWRALEDLGRLWAVFDSAADAIITVDEAGTMGSVNPGAGKMFGYDTKEMIGRNVGILIPVLAWQSGDGNAKTGIAEMIGRQHRVPACHKNGGQFHVDLTVGETATGRRRRFTIMARDITEQKQLEAKILGADQNEISGKNDYDLFPSELAGKFQEEGRQVMRGRAALRSEVLVGKKDAPKRVEVIRLPILNEHGEVIGTAGSSRDITERKHIEAALKESEERFRQFSESIHVGFWILDLNPRRIVYVNRAFTKISGLEAGEVYCNSDPRMDVVHEEDRHAVQRAFEEWLKGDPSFRLETDYRIVRPDGAVRWIHDSGVKLQNEEGRVFRVIGISEDITDRKRADEATDAMHKALERKARELAVANRELESFAYSVSHDLRAPLRHIDGYINLLLKEAGPSLDGTPKRYLATISRAASRMANLIDDLLEFSRTGRTELNKKMVSLEHLVRGIIRNLKSDTENRDIVWNVQPLPDVFGDAALFQQAFFNLIENAVKYTRPRQQARIEIGCIESDREEVVIFVGDNGVGFDMKYVDKLFGVFQRLHRVEEFEGTGIGLANVARIIQRHGGRVWAVGEKDKGATIYVSIPMSGQTKHA